MKNLFLLFISLSLLININLSAQQYGWVKIAQLGLTYYNDIYSVYFADSLKGWIGMSHYIFRTTDGGKNWINSVAELVPSSITFDKNNIGWVVGNASSLGRIFKTTNSGLTWLSSRDKNNQFYLSTFSKIRLENITVGYTVNTNQEIGIMVRTTNGGTTWTERTIADSINKLIKIQFVDSLYGWILGWGRGYHALFRTTDGGTQWDLISNPPFTRVFTFLDRKNGWAVSQSGGWSYFYRTTDSGITWATTDSLTWDDPELSSTALSFVDSLNGWAFGTTFYQGDLAGIIFRTTNGGYDWYTEYVGQPRRIRDGIMLDKHHGWAVGDDGIVLSYQPLTNVAELADNKPKTIMLHQNFPNPFNSITIISYQLVNSSYVTLKVYDILGKEVSILVDEAQKAGEYRVSFNGKGLPSGIYTYTLTVASNEKERHDYTETKQMFLIK